MLVGLQFSLLVLPSFLKTGITWAYFKPVGKEKLDRELLKLSYKNRAMASLFPLMIGTGMSVVWDGILGSSLFISSKFCSDKTNLKINFELFVFEILFLMQIILGWSLYFRWKLLPYQHINLKFDLQKKGSLGKERFIYIQYTRYIYGYIYKYIYMYAYMYI